MLEFDNSHIDELCDLIRYDNAVLFLGQDYQMSLGERNFFTDEINIRICKRKVTHPSYPSLWAKMSEDSTSGKKEGGHAILDDLQRNRMLEIAAEIPNNIKLSEVLNIGWSSVVTSSIDPGLKNCVNCNPIYTVSERPAGIANKKNLHITYLFGCITETNSYPMTYKIRGTTRTDAETMYTRVLKEAIQYSGALVIDGWNPIVDWASVETVLGNGLLDADMPFPKIFIFSCTPEIKDRIYNNEQTEELAESDKLVISNNSLFECLESFIQATNKEKQQEKEALRTSEVISFQRGKRIISIGIPREEINNLDPDRIHLMRPRDRMQVAFDRNGIRNLTIKFLANSNGNFPFWQGYLHGCYFERDIYSNTQKTGLYDRAIAVLQSSNLHKKNSTIIVHGPSNSGKSILLGKLALDLSKNYPVLFINGELEATDPEITRYRHENLVNFINTYLTRNVQLGEKIRCVVIWDNDAFIDKLQSYIELANELAESNVILIGSAYEIRDLEGEYRKPKRGVEYIHLSATLDPATEFPNMKKMLSSNLGTEFVEALSSARKRSLSQVEQHDLRYSDNRLLLLLQRTFRVAGDDTALIIDEAINRAGREAAGTEELMRNRFEEVIEKAAYNYNVDMNGLAEILEHITEDDKP